LSSLGTPKIAAPPPSQARGGRGSQPCPFRHSECAIDTVDDEILAIGHLIGDANLEHATNDRFRFPRTIDDGEVASWVANAVRRHDFLHKDHDVTALTQTPQLSFAMTDAVANMMARHHEVLTALVVPSDDDMGVMSGVEMIGGNLVAS
jgi:hypothetical protein